MPLNTVNKLPSFSNKIIRIYVLGTSLLMLFFVYAFQAGILITENTMMERRINIVAPFHLNQYKEGRQGIIKIDPLLSLYDSHTLLPAHIQSKIAPQWTGSMQLLLDDEKEREYQIVAQSIMINGSPAVVYAVEDSDALEWDDTKFIYIVLSLAGIGLLLFLVTTAYMVKTAKKVAFPFLQVAKRLETDTKNQFEVIETDGERCAELAQIVSALNTYRSRLSMQMEREQSFTRYVSHELRTPMMLIKGALSNLRRNVYEGQSKPIDKISKATDQMQALTQTFLFLARDAELDCEHLLIDDGYLKQLQSELAEYIEASHIDFKWQLLAPFELKAHPQLFRAVLDNLLKNAFACSVDGQVTLIICNEGVSVIDNGVGLETKPRGYEGFGIGLILVKDVCDKYHWQFELTNNENKGCTASIEF